MKGEDIKDLSFSEKLRETLVKKALGYDVTEVVEEYSEEDGEIKLVKKKVTVKNVPPDVTALKILLDGGNDDVSEYSDERLESEKNRLLAELLVEEKINKEKKNCNRKNNVKNSPTNSKTKNS